MTRKDIAIIGGTFDPVHNGHIAMAKYLADNYIVDEVWMLPSYSSPHKDIDTKISFDDRVTMLKLAFENDTNIKISLFEKEYYDTEIIKFKKSFEIKNTKKDLGYNNTNTDVINIDNDLNNNFDVKTYTIDILNAIKKKYLNIRIHFIVGFDSIKQIGTWHSYKSILNDYWFYIFDRTDNEFKTMEQKKMYLDNLGKKDKITFYYEFMNTTIPDISSTEIRTLLKDKENCKGKLLTLIPESVYNYIISNNLYN